MKAEFAKWERKGKPMPPPHIYKQRVLREYAKRYGIKVFVETGTYYGDMVEAMKTDFDRIYSIEISKDLYEQARMRFKRVEYIEILQGDSGIEIGKLMEKINHRTIFWLDGHYSGGETARGEKDTPIFEELRHILNASDKGHVIIVDDAQCFGTDPSYPSIKELSEFIQSQRSNLDITVRDDIIRITPKQ